MHLDLQKLPRHVAIIMDGNRRWARAQGKNPVEGHKYVTDYVIEALADRCIELGIPYLTLWAFSTENWDRDQAELKALMQIFRLGFQKKTKEWMLKKGIKIKVLGELDRFPKDIADMCRDWMESSKTNTKLTITFALNYGGRDEVKRAFNRILNEKKELHKSGELTEKDWQVTEEEIGAHLDTANTPDPDLIIRPGGQFRLSGFMPWQSVYSELYFSEVLMPDFSADELDKALLDFTERQRRFGK